jgi:negative elongation factor C/D
MTEAERLLYARVIRKWERLLEVLQGAMVDPLSAQGSTPFFRKRRLDVALTISELHQRQRRRLWPQDDGEEGVDATDTDSDNENSGSWQAEVETAVLNFLRSYCLGTQVDDRILDKMLPDTLVGESAKFIGNLLIEYPIAVEALLGYIFKPGNQRVRSIVTRNKCARLAALAVLSAEQQGLEEARKIDPDVPASEVDEVGLTRMLSEGSQLCEQLENMVSFLVTTDANRRKGSTSLNPGEKLCSLAVKSAPVSRGVAIWAREITKGSEFVTSASYPTISPSIMSLVRIVYLHHPFTRDDTSAVAFEFLKHANPDIAYQTMNHIKEHSLRLLLFLCVRGEAPTILGKMTHLLEDRSKSFLDAALIRYFVSGLLQVVSPPLSIPFIRSLLALLKTPACAEAVKTSYFDETSKKRLDGIMNYVLDRAAGKFDKRSLAKQDIFLIQSVSSVYLS